MSTEFSSVSILARAGQVGFHLDLQEHSGEDPHGILGLDDLAIVDPVAVLGGEVLGRLKAAHQITHSLFGVIDDLHRRGQPRGEILEFLASGTKILGRRVRCFPCPPASSRARYAVAAVVSDAA
ncbi:hypothetical protein ACFWMR_14850 [Amycolatopsis thailandensis]|uniref:hypothetical protein n=1 Tax=Amycolatopsis thailandensis TaxID=589330 RepID=UPI0036561DC8